MEFAQLLALLRSTSSISPCNSAIGVGAVHHQQVAETDMGTAQDLLAQGAAMGMHQREPW